jgi:serine/threonine protein kinase
MEDPNTFETCRTFEDKKGNIFAEAQAAAEAAAADCPDLQHHDQVFVIKTGGVVHRVPSYGTKVFSEWYEVVEHLGAGAFGDVMLVKPRKDDPANPKVKKGQSAACKVINDWNSSAEDAQDQLAEARLLRSIEHPNIVGIREYFVSSSGGEEKLHIIMDLANGGDLAGHIEKRAKTGEHYSEEAIRHFGAGLLQAVAFLHRNHVLHRDIKPANIFIDGDTARTPRKITLGDFGLAKILTNQESAHGPDGTAVFMAPEIYAAQPYNYPADIFAVGGVLNCAMGLMETPYGSFEEMNSADKSTMWHIVMNGIHRSLSQTATMYSHELHDVVKKMMAPDPNDRPTAAKLLEDLCPNSMQVL